MGEEKSKKAFELNYKLMIGIAAVIGIGLLLLGNSNAFRKEESHTDTKGSESDDVLGYTEILEGKVYSIVKSVCGGEPSVLITLDCSGESVYAGNVKENDTYTSGEISASSSERDYLIISDGDGEGGLLLREIYPKIRGIAVVCQGGGDTSVKLEIIELLSVAFGISASKVCVAEGG